MNRLCIDNALFAKLASEPPMWWSALVEDKYLSIQIRKENYVDVYFNGGNIIKGLKYAGDSFKAKTHYKYIPVESESGDYVPFIFEDNSIKFGNVKPIPLGCFCVNSLKGMKDNIRKFYPSDSEKAIQYSFIRNDPYFIDSEFEYTFKENERTKIVRIDLVRVDVQQKKIVFVEVKTIGDARLYNGEVVSQLKDYRNFILMHRSELLGYYKKILTIKKRLGILPECLIFEDIDEYQVLDKPLLLFGNCEQAWIDKFSGELDNKIKNCAVGAYYFGRPDYNCDLIRKTERNRHIFCGGDI